MLVTISPAKKLDWAAREVATTDPVFSEEAAYLASVARHLSVDELRKLMSISEDLAKLNKQRFLDFVAKPSGDVTRPAALAFAGDTYQGLEAASLDVDELTWAEDHLRILSGLYGVLRPLDAIQPYRLEMGSRLKTKRGKSLYQYWGSQIAEALNAQADEIATDTLINCASTEYFSAVDLNVLKPRVVTPVFLEEKAGQAKVISFYAKKARGAMARFIIQRRITDLAGLSDFDLGGYALDRGESSSDTLVFRRDLDTLAKAAE
ncbi:peroxide stress protein YaaA [Qingshengfaniella alkalisoli]|uniref:UPF0246 protein FPZ52_10520 n=1 Tax=Qingshengfaniella alkalisoli TaxID=2599296 RepID=A0A5B8IZG7_9RHOB|nr:peroxide stress protein YaaA [Qingshengfaniella alkalisoli]QDY70008.1 peroxide stress protein YaaA [Qingshengfaniella alkalisoli]